MKKKRTEISLTLDEIQTIIYGIIMLEIINIINKEIKKSFKTKSKK